MWPDSFDDGSVVNEMFVHIFLLIILLMIGVVGLLVLGGGA